MKAYLQLSLSPQGRAIINAQEDSAEGYLPLSPQDLLAERRKLDDL